MTDREVRERVQRQRRAVHAVRGRQPFLGAWLPLIFMLVAGAAIILSVIR